MRKVESRMSPQGLTRCQGCQCHIKVESAVAATKCPFCGYQMATQPLPASLTFTRSGSKRRGRTLLAAALLSTSVAFSAAPMGCACYGSPPEPYSLGNLATNQPANLLLFGDVQDGQILKKSFLLYNDGQLELTVSRLGLSDNQDSAFKFIDPPSTPFTLLPGKDNGKLITLQFAPNGTTSATARVEIASADANNVDQNGDFFVLIRYQIASPNPQWSCGGTIQFGSVALGTALTKECVLTNHGNADLAIASVSYSKGKGGDNVDFKWISPSPPMKVKAGTSVPVLINYMPSDTNPLEDQGAFVLDVTGRTALQLQLKGTTESSRVDVIGVYPPCAADADCTTIDPRLTCRKDSFSAEDQCLAASHEKPLLKLPPAMPGQTSTRAFLIRNLSAQPLTIKSLQWATKQGLFQVQLLVPLPVTLPPQKRLQASVVYTPTDTTKVNDELQIEFDQAPITSLLVSY